MQLQFYGAAGQVTGSCHILECNGSRMLLDCGMIQGRAADEQGNYQPFPFEPADIDAVVLSHAHIDHSGRLPLLVKRGFQGPIYTQRASLELCRVLLHDSAKLQQQDLERGNRHRARHGKAPLEPLYRSADVDAALARMEGIDYHRPLEIVPGVTLRLLDAGHILGSAVVVLDLEEAGERRRLAFTGDLGQSGTPILRDPEPVESADLVLMECTYGDRDHRDHQATVDELGEIISSAGTHRGNVLIPAFAVGRSQEILYHLAGHYEDWAVDRFRLFLDSPMAIAATEIYWKHPELYDAEAATLHEEAWQSLLPNLELTAAAEESMRINEQDSGAVVVAGSGMCTGGRIIHHLKHNLANPGAQVVIVGFQVQGSLGRRLVDGARTVRIHGAEIPVRARIHTLGGFSAHADRSALAGWYEDIPDRPPVWLVHGEAEAAQAFRGFLRQRTGTAATIATPGDRIDLLGLPVAGA